VSRQWRVVAANLIKTSRLIPILEGIIRFYSRLGIAGEVLPRIKSLASSFTNFSLYALSLSIRAHKISFCCSLFLQLCALSRLCSYS
jgi:hypothetical protein